jgi:hypothetical protein
VTVDLVSISNIDIQENRFYFPPGTTRNRRLWMIMICTISLQVQEARDARRHAEYQQEGQSHLHPYRQTRRLPK